MLKLECLVYSLHQMALTVVKFDLKEMEMVFCYQNCSDLPREKLLKFKAEGREFANILRSLEQFWVTECFFNMSLEVSHI